MKFRDRDSRYGPRPMPRREEPPRKAVETGGGRGLLVAVVIVLLLVAGGAGAYYYLYGLTWAPWIPWVPGWAPVAGGDGGSPDGGQPVEPEPTPRPLTGPRFGAGHFAGAERTRQAVLPPVEGGAPAARESERGKVFVIAHFALPRDATGVVDTRQYRFVDRQGKDFGVLGHRPASAEAFIASPTLDAESMAGLPGSGIDFLFEVPFSAIVGEAKIAADALTVPIGELY